MILEKKYPVGLINADDAPHILPQDAIISMSNMRVNSGRDGDTGYFKSIRATLKLTNTEVSNMDIPEGSVCVGGCSDPSGRYVVWFTKCDRDRNYDQINFYDIQEGKYWLVVRSDMGAIGSIRGGLNFTKYIDAVDIVNDTLYWTDDNEEPRKLHLGAAIRATNPTLNNTPLYDGWQYSWTAAPYTFVDNSSLTLICKPPAFPPSIMKFRDTTSSINLISDESFQFATQYVYYSGERSVFSMFSESSGINAKHENFNYIGVFLRQDQTIVPSGVRMIRLIARVNSTGRCFVVKVWDKEVASEMEEINSFNSGGHLSFNFYYNNIGEFIDDVTVKKHFESIPLKAGTQSVCKNRLFYGNLLKGYDTPTSSSSLLLRIPDGETIGLKKEPLRAIAGKFQWFRTGDSSVQSRSAWYVYMTNALEGVSDEGYYEINSTVINTYETVSRGNLPGSIQLADVTFRGSTFEAVESGLRPGGYTSYVGSLTYVSLVFTMFQGSSSANNISLPSLLHNSEIHVGIVFYDRFLRKCGVVLPKTYYAGPVQPDTWGGIVYLPTMAATPTKRYSIAEWELNNNDAANEIPDWAYYYAPVQKAKDRLGYFISSYAMDPRYAEKDENGLYDYSETTYSVSDTVAIAIDTTALVHAGLGYVYSEGDMCTLVGSLGTFNLPVIGQDGEYILLAPKDIGNILTAMFVYEIYTPVKSENQQSFFEIGQMYPVVNPGTDTRAYSVTSGNIKPDTYLAYRTIGIHSYTSQSMSPNDYLYKKWVTHYGRINVITKTGQERKRGAISFSNTWIAGSTVNGMSAFETENEEGLFPEMGTINKLILTSKAQGEGSVMLAICENNTASIYIGESELYDQSGNSFVAKSDKVIGSINVLRGGYGTRHPATACSFNGNVWWYDNTMGAFLKYSANGIFPVSGNKMNSPSLELSGRLTNEDFAIGGIDPYSGEYLFQPKFSGEGFPWYRFGISPNSTTVFSMAENKCRGRDEYTSECLINAGTDLYSIKDGNLYVHEKGDGHSMFYGKAVIPRICVAANQEGAKLKRYQTISVESNIAPIFTQFRTESPNVQYSSLVAGDYSLRDGVFYAGILRDVLSPNVPGNEFDKLYKGDRMEGPYMAVEMQFDTVEEVRMKFINIGFKMTAGHEQI